MMDTSLPYLLIFFAYIIGSVPFGLLIARSKGIDLRKTGSGNIGATNVLRSTGKVSALITLFGDSLKGAAAVYLCRSLNTGELMEGIAGITAVLGHMFSVFLSFKGGKGVATGFGALAVYSPSSAVIAISVWLITALYTRYSSLAAISSFLSLPVVFFLLDESWIKIIFAFILAFLIVLKHVQNVRRLTQGTESKIGKSVT
jgi:glycerol-3-phosphate acyltransferase PlsY